jgi:cytochrome c oxidase cbb3-type subunit 3
MRNWTDRTTALAAFALLAIAPANAQGTVLDSLVSAFENPGMETLYLLLVIAVMQAVIILTLAGVTKSLGGTGTIWVDYIKGRRAGAIALVLVLAGATEAQAATPATIALVTTQTLFWYLFTANLVLFVIIVAQLTMLRGMVRTLAREKQAEAAAVAEEPSWADTLLTRLTRRPPPEKEKDLLMHHAYDGIRELDNVLPPWWLWLFYGTVIWSAVYLVNVHVVRIWPDQDTAYELEMAQAKADIEAYVAKQAAAVDEYTVTALTDASVLGTGKRIFNDFCKACHGPEGQGNEVGPNLTDTYWLHGGSINDVFRTVKYGVQDKGMQSWKDVLNPQEIQAVASYILSLQGTNPPNARAPQGEPYVPAGNEPTGNGTPQADAVDSEPVAQVQ